MDPIAKIVNLAKLYIFRRRWRTKNPHNETVPKRLFPIDIVTVGKYSYGLLDVYTWGAKEERLEIGSFVSIASGVKFLLGGNHRTDTLLTFPVKVKFFKEKREATSKGPIIVEDDVWIGMDAMILSGSRIGRGAVIGAMTVVAGEVPPYSIVVGNPGRVISRRFEGETTRLLCSLPLKKITSEFILMNETLFTSEMNTEKVNQAAKNIIYLSEE